MNLENVAAEADQINNLTIQYYVYIYNYKDILLIKKTENNLPNKKTDMPTINGSYCSPALLAIQ